MILPNGAAAAMVQMLCVVDTRCISSVVAKVDVRPGQKTGVSGLCVVSLVASPTAAAANPLQRQNWLWRLERCQGRSWSWNVVAG